MVVIYIISEISPYRTLYAFYPWLYFVNVNGFIIRYKNYILNEKNKVMKHYILNCICAALITLLFTLSFKFTPYQTLILYFVMLTSFEIRNFIDNYKKQ